jgi:hypothetical protein
MTEQAEIEEVYILPKPKTKYWINYQNCYWNTSWNTKHLKIKTNKARYGLIYYKGKCLYGNDSNFNLFEKIPARKFYYGCGHTWTETKDGEIIDWVVNHTLKKSSNEKILWRKDELLELGFEFKYYENEEAIKKKTDKLFGCKCKGKDVNEECSVLWAKNFWRSSDL